VARRKVKGWLGVFWPGPPAPPTHWAVDAEFFYTVHDAEVTLAYRVKGKRPRRPPHKVQWRDGVPYVVEVTRPWLFDAVVSADARILLHRVEGLTYDMVRAAPFGEVIVYMEGDEATSRKAEEGDDDHDS